MSSYALLEGVLVNYITYVYGNPLIAGFFIMFFIMLIGIKSGWSFDVFMIIGTTALMMIGGYMLPQDFQVVAYIVAGVIIAMAMLKLFNR